MDFILQMIFEQQLGCHIVAAAQENVKIDYLCQLINHGDKQLYLLRV